MSIDHSQPTSFLSLRLLKPSHRSRPEQIVGLFIFLLLSLACALLNHWISAFHSEWYQGLSQAPWAFANWPLSPLWIGYHTLLPLSMWTLWRRFSLRSLKLELSLFLSLLALQAVWSSSFFLFRETLLSLVALLLLFCDLLLSTFLFWIKERFSAQILVLPLLWIFYMVGINMVICISNP